MKLSRNYRNIFWGMLLLVAAVYMVASKLWVLPDISIFSMIAPVFLLYLFGKGIKEGDFGKMLFALAFAYLIFDEPLGLPVLSFWTVVGAALLGAIGLSMIFHPKKKKYIAVQMDADHLSESREDWNEGTVQVSNVFGETIKYLNSDNFVGGEFENKFGELSIYFDNVSIQNGMARIHVLNSFGETRLFIPKEWKVMNHLGHSFGDIHESGRYEGSADCTLIIEGTASFGEIEIHYI